MSRGAICSRGLAATQGLYNPDRWPKPRVRRNGRLDPIEWDEALALFSRELGALRTSGTAGRAVFLDGGAGGAFASLLDEWLAVHGIPAPLRYDPLLELGVMRAHRELYGVAWPGLDFKPARLVVSFGADFLDTWAATIPQQLDYAESAASRSGARGGRAGCARACGAATASVPCREIFTTHSRQGTVAVLVALAFGLGWTLLALDLSMTLDLHFESTLYSWWMFMGGWLAALMAFALLVIAWRRFLDVPQLVTEQHFHDVGKLCFAFTAFWGYLTFGQYLIIWYGNLTFETHWMQLRLIEPWIRVTLPMVVLAFLLPFCGLLSRAAKVYPPTLAGFALASLAGLWLLRYVEVYPSLHYPAVALPLGIWELGVTAGYLGLWGLSYVAFMNAFPRTRVVLMTSPYRDEVQVPYDPQTFEPLPAHD